MKVPPIDPESSADGALLQYDKNKDGSIVGEELASCPALLDALKNRIDKNSDKQVSRDELVERFRMWAHGGVGISYMACRVTAGGQPVEGAQISLVPEKFLNNVIQPANGTTDNTGIALLAIDKSHLPVDLQNLQGVQQGMYRVEITHPTRKIPAKYNHETTLGLEVSFESGRNMVTFAL